MLDIFSVYMDRLKQHRRIRVYLPDSYLEGKTKYPVLYMHDGQNVFSDEEAIGGHSLHLEHYLDETQLGVIVVGIDQNPDERVNEYCPWVNGEYSRKILGHVSNAGGKGSTYIDFIAHELKPMIDAKYRTIPDLTAMAGISLGGLITTYAMCRYPHIFQHIAVCSSAFYRNQEEIEKMIRHADLSSVQSVYMDCGEKEAGNDEPINKEFLFSNQSVYGLLKEKVPHAAFAVISEAEHHYSFFRERVPEILSFLTMNPKRM